VESVIKRVKQADMARICCGMEMTTLVIRHSCIKIFRIYEWQNKYSVSPKHKKRKGGGRRVSYFFFGSGD